MAARDRAGIAPIQDALDRIAAIDSPAAYYAYLSQAPFDGVGVTLRQPFDLQALRSRYQLARDQFGDGQGAWIVRGCRSAWASGSRNHQ